MTTLQLPIDERLVQRMGIEAIKERIKQELEQLYTEHLAGDIKAALDAQAIDNEQELEQAREKAWNEIKKEYLSF